MRATVLIIACEEMCVAIVTEFLLALFFFASEQRTGTSDVCVCVHVNIRNRRREGQMVVREMKGAAIMGAL